MRSLALCAALSLAGCRAPARPVIALDGASPARDAAAPIAADTGVAADGSAAPRPPVRCAIDGPDRVLGAMPLRRLRIAAHDREAMLVAEYTSAFAPEPAGDAVDQHAWRWWRFDLQNPTQRDAPRGQSDPLGARPRRVEPESESPCAYAQWDEDAARPAWDGARWTRWRHAAAWGGAACAPCGSLIARLGVEPAQVEERPQTDMLESFEVSAGPHAPFAAVVVKRFDARGPFDADRTPCSEASIALLWRGGERALSERELARWSYEDPRGPENIAVASNGRERVIVTQSKEPAARIELRRVSAEGRMIGAATAIYTGAYIRVVSAAFLEDTLVLVWSERAALTAASPSTVRWTQLDPARPESMSPVQTLLDRRPISVDELSLASDGATLALTWAERPERRAPTVLRVAVGSSIAQWRSHVEAGGVELFQTTQPGSIYRTSAAVDRDRLWVAFDEPLRGYDQRPRVRSLRCEPAPSP